jgi:ANTAR domain
MARLLSKRWVRIPVLTPASKARRDKPINMQGRKTTPKPFQNSLSALAQVAMRETEADGYAFFRKDQVIDASGTEIHADCIAGGAGQIVTYRLGADGILAFIYKDENRARQVRQQLDRIAASIEAVWSAAQTAGRYSELANEVADLEVQLMDSKISDRVRGYLSSRGDSSLVENIARHVEGVLRPASAGRMLEELSRSLEEEVEERRLTNRAKAILQSVHGMSEEQAHDHLRKTSRKTRRKLKDVAADLIENVRTT